MLKNPKVVGSIPTVVRHVFQLDRCGYTLRVTPQTSFSSEDINKCRYCVNIQLFLINHVGRGGISILGRALFSIFPFDLK